MSGIYGKFSDFECLEQEIIKNSLVLYMEYVKQDNEMSKNDKAIVIDVIKEMQLDLMFDNIF